LKELLIVRFDIDLYFLDKEGPKELNLPLYTYYGDKVSFSWIEKEGYKRPVGFGINFSDGRRMEIVSGGELGVDPYVISTRLECRSYELSNYDGLTIRRVYLTRMKCMCERGGIYAVVEVDGKIINGAVSNGAISIAFH
jgi:hypothetical protein